MKIKSIKKIQKVNEVYNLTVKDNHNYFANDILVSNCKNPNSQQGAGFLRLRPQERLALSGTPLINSIEDLYIIFNWLDQDNHSFTQYKNHYCIFGGFGDHQIIAYKNKNEIINKLSHCMLRRTKDILELPPITHIPVYVEMSTPQAKIYEEVKTLLKKEIDKIRLSPLPLAKLTRLRQATGYTGLLSTNVQECCKIDHAIQIIDDCVANGEKAVIFTEFAEIAKVAFEKFKKFNPGLIIGEVDLVQRDEEVRRLQEDDDCHVLIGTTKAMGTGITLTRATNVIFLDEPWNMANKKQAWDRCHRIGTTGTVNVYTLMCEDTYDEIVNEIVEKKGELSDFFIDGKVNREYVNTLLHRIFGDD